MSNLSLAEQTKILDEHIWCTHHKDRKKGIRRWSKAYFPKGFDTYKVDSMMGVSQISTEQTTDIKKGVFTDDSVASTIKPPKQVDNTVIATLIYDCGNRCFSTDLFKKINL